MSKIEWPKGLQMSVGFARSEASKIVNAALDGETEVCAKWERQLLKVTGNRFPVQEFRALAASDKYVGKKMKGPGGVGMDYDREMGELLFKTLSIDLFQNPSQLFWFGEDANPASDSFWIGLQLNVFPKECALRWTSESRAEIGTPGWNDRFFANAQRIWMKTLWWTYYFAWQGTLEETKNVVKRIGSNNISQIFERPRGGFDIGFLRDFLGGLEDYKEMFEQRKHVRISNQRLINLMMKLDANFSETVCPELLRDSKRGYAPYVEYLFSTLPDHMSASSGLDSEDDLDVGHEEEQPETKMPEKKTSETPTEDGTDDDDTGLGGFFGFFRRG